MRVRAMERGDAAAWDSYVAAHPGGTLFHGTRWREQVLDAAPHEPAYLVAEDDAGRVRGVLPAFVVRSLLGGDVLVSVPYGVYGGVLADGAEAERALLAAAIARAERDGVGHVELRHVRPIAGEGLSRSDLYVTFVRELPADPEECLAIIPRKSRATTRNARDKHGMALIEGRELLPRFHDLFLRNKAALGSPAFSREFFERLLFRYGDDAWLNGVMHEGQVIAAVISFRHGDTLNPYYSGSLPGTERLGSMNFLYWQTMELAARRGLRRYDFGRSRVETGAFDFKRNMGFEPMPLAYQHWVRGGASAPQVNPSNPKFERFQRAWRALPVPVLRFLGPLLMRHLP